ncbi:hypothetical protein [Novipirellula caenicola]|uniref:hypothetical protein n=1 Tax=Novipirellula caenicola TaxID=1536901 RepID=UPI0031E75EDB
MFAATNGLDDKQHGELKRTPKRIVSMLTRLIARSDTVAESVPEYNVGDEYEYRDAEYEYKYEESRKPEPNRASEDGLHGFSDGNSIARPR